MVGEPFELLGQTVGRESLDGVHDVSVEGAPPLLQQAAVGNLMGERVLEGVFEVGKETRFIEELAGLQVRDRISSSASGRSAIACRTGKGTSVQE